MNPRQGRNKECEERQGEIERRRERPNGHMEGGGVTVDKEGGCSQEFYNGSLILQAFTTDQALNAGSPNSVHTEPPSHITLTHPALHKHPLGFTATAATLTT
ncbi:hypothetical protein CRENBAI_009894, partial [Crenichthys baileyi]